jgi:hypothetical protein
MPTRQEVYNVIDSERDYQEALPRRTLSHNTIGDYNTLLRSYLRRTDDAWTDNAGVEASLHVVRKIAAIGVRAMEELGFVRRGYQYVLETPVNREAVYNILDEERLYQDRKLGTLGERNSVGDFITYMKNLSRESDQLSKVDEPNFSIDSIRQLTAVAITCMEKFGAPKR